MVEGVEIGVYGWILEGGFVRCDDFCEEDGGTGGGGLTIDVPDAIEDLGCMRWLAGHRHVAAFLPHDGAVLSGFSEA